MPLGRGAASVHWPSVLERPSCPIGKPTVARPPFPWEVPGEGLAVRIRIRVGLTAFCLGLAGCTAAHKQETPDAGRPFIGAPQSRPTTRDPSAPPAEVDNLLAGQVLDKAFNHRLSNASIQVVDLQDANATPAARLDVSANRDGYFFIPGLQRGHHYQLIARIKEGDHVLSGTTLAMPPNPRLSIFLSEDYTSPSTPAPLGPPTPPGKAQASPSAALEAPSKVRQDGNDSGVPPLNKTKIAIENGATESGGFERAPTPPRVEIPGPPPPVIPPPPPVMPSSPPEEQASHAGPSQRTAPPFCVLLGNRLDNFALPDLNGRTWEFRRDPPRKLVLLDFWKSNCNPCLAAISHLRGLQEKYGRDGLEVVGVACEDPGRPADQIQHVRNAKVRFNANYTILIGSDSAGQSPVRSQFLVDSFPRMVLIDESGEIVWRSSSEGLSDQQYKELEMEIYRKFHPPAR
jgi:thiol-disulfide isomerase/thioredoxin